MQNSFWLDRWQNHQIGFHQPEGQPMLRAHWSALGLASTARVLVPLCGKARDMAWLADQGHAVTGIELSATAAHEFFVESAREYGITRDGPFQRFSDGVIDILVGDFFDLSAERLARFDAWYDRAALIALPPTMREQYVAHLLGHLPPRARGLLITFAYDQALMEGPPFSVDDDAVHRLFRRGAAVDLLAQRHGPPASDKLRQQGLEETREGVYRVTIKRGPGLAP